MVVFSHQPFKIDAPVIDRSSTSSSYYGGPLGIRAICDACNLWDVIKACVQSFGWLFARNNLDEKTQDTERDQGENNSGGTSEQLLSAR
jgi:hypothetical protein